MPARMTIQQRMMAVYRNEMPDRIPIGIIYRKERPVYEEQFPVLKDMPLVKRKIDPSEFEIGVIVARFQVHKLHEAHIRLIDKVCENHKKVIIFFFSRYCK